MTRLALALSLATLWAVPGLGQSEESSFLDRQVYLECPCRLTQTDGRATLMVGVRNFSERRARDLHVSIRAFSDEGDRWLATVEFGAVAAGGLRSGTHDVMFDVSAELPRRVELYLALTNGSGVWHRVDMDGRIDPRWDFDIANLDYLRDTDGDGVGDLNEDLAGTDVADAESTPGDVVLDVLAIHDRALAERNQYDPYTGIRHAVMGADQIFRDNATGVRLRLVGFVEVEVEDENDEWSGVDAERIERLRREYGADIPLMFRNHQRGWFGGWAWSGGGANGYIRTDSVYATMFSFSATTVAHEIGHLLGLHHSFPQENVGTFRWSRGHYLRGATNCEVLRAGTITCAGEGTVMSYGHGLWARSKFSNPDADCGGVPCGKDIDLVDGAHSVLSLNVTRFQVAAFRRAKRDSDADGVVDAADAFPDDAGEWRDIDGDGIGDVADEDDDGDGFADWADARPWDHDPDADGDGVPDSEDAFPNDPAETSDRDGDGIGDNADDSDGDGVADARDLFPTDPKKTDLGSYLIRGERTGDGAGLSMAAGDVDGDRVADFAIGAPWGGAVYLLSGVDLASADAADGEVDRVVGLGQAASQPASWKFVLRHWSGSGYSVAMGDWSGDGRDDVLIGHPWLDRRGSVYLIDGANLAFIDSADGTADGVVQLANVADDAGSWQLIGASDSGAGTSIGVTGGANSEGVRHVIIGAPWEADGRGAAYVVSSASLVDADAADGTADGVVQLDEAVRQIGSWKLVGEQDDRAGSRVAAGDMDGDGDDEFIVARPGKAVHIVSGDRLRSLQAAGDSVVELSNIADGAESWELVGGAWGWAPAVADVDYDAFPDLMTGYGHVISSRDLEAADAEDGVADGVVRMVNAVSQPHSLHMPGVFNSVVGDVYGDGAPELVFSQSGTRPATHLVSRSDLAPRPDGYIYFNDLAGEGWVMASTALDYFAVPPAGGDVDGDGLTDVLLAPNYRVHRSEELFLVMASDMAPLDAVDGEVDGRLWLGNVAGDEDGDGIWNTLDQDDDGDDVPDRFDPFPLDASEQRDSDRDGYGDNRDVFPQDSSEHTDTDGDGIGDNADTDDDNDGIADAEDDYPWDTDNDGVDNADDADDDNDGVADAEDAFPLDATETADSDGDGVGDNADADDDNDGVADAEDAFPLDASESADADGDGVGDNADAFPEDASESADTDGDGVGDNADADDDNDGVADAEDDRPLDAQSSDHGNARSSATPIALASETPGVIDPGNDTDYFRFELAAASTVVAESSGALNTVGTLFDFRGNRIVQDNDGAGHPNFRIERALDAGVYYFRVHSSGTATGRYVLRLDLAASASAAERVRSGRDWNTP